MREVSKAITTKELGVTLNIIIPSYYMLAIQMLFCFAMPKKKSINIIFKCLFTGLSFQKEKLHFWNNIYKLSENRCFDKLLPSVWVFSTKTIILTAPWRYLDLKPKVNKWTAILDITKQDTEVMRHLHGARLHHHQCANPGRSTAGPLLPPHSAKHFSAEEEWGVSPLSQ